MKKLLGIFIPANFHKRFQFITRNESCIAVLGTVRNTDESLFLAITEMVDLRTDSVEEDDLEV